MIPVPKPKFFERKVPTGKSKYDFLDEISARQTHILRDAIDRLIFPSVLDPAGILMLRSVRIIFEMIGLKPESVKFKKEIFNSDNLVKALTQDPKRCPAIVVVIDNFFTGNFSLHVMVAENALKGKEFTNELSRREKWFINCKNSYRDDISEPDTLKIQLELTPTQYFSETGYRLAKPITAYYISIEE